MPLHKEIHELLPEVQEMLEKAISELKEKDIRFSILETYREQVVQDAYYSQGRKPIDEVNYLREKAGLIPIGINDNYIITKTKNSYHTLRRAVDLVPVLSNGRIPWIIKDASTAALWMHIGDIMKKYGFEWGGDWNPKNEWGIGWDPAHYQI